MNKDTKQSLASYLIAMGDDELILGQRDGEWCGHAPILEEDIAFANIALDEIGHANVWYQLAAELLDEDVDTYPDWLAFRRPAADFRNILMVELPKGDWAFSMLRQYLFDSFEVAHLKMLKVSEHKPLADAAAKILSEETYHRRHTEAWVKRLALGTDESKSRMQAALDELWIYAQQLGQDVDNSDELIKPGYLPDSDQLRIAWSSSTSAELESWGLSIPDASGSISDRSTHSEHLEALITEMQEVPRMYPEGVW